MITEDYISYETAKLLKEKGFDIPCNAYFIEVEKETSKNKFKRRFCHSSVVANRNAYKSEMANHYYFSCPTLQMAMKWLREVYKLQVSPRYDEVEDEKERLHYVWFFDILSMNPYKMLFESEHGYNTYEEAAESAIRHCLENLI